MSQVFQRRILARQVRAERRERARRREPEIVDQTPHRLEECPRMLREADGRRDEGPCPFVSCKHHLYADVTEDGSLRVYRPALEPWELPDTCALDVACRGSHGFDVIGYHLGISSRQANEVCAAAIAKCGPALAAVLAASERERPGCCDHLDLARRHGGWIDTGRACDPDPRGDDPESIDRTTPEGYVPLEDAEVTIVGRHRELPRLTEEHLLRGYRVGRLAQTLYLMFVCEAELRRASVSALTRAYSERTSSTTKPGRIVAALDQLEDAGLVRCQWRACGAIRRLVAVSLVSSLKEPDSGTDCPRSRTQARTAPFLRAAEKDETVEVDE